MPKPFRVLSTRPLPADAEIVPHEGTPHIRMKERGRAVLYRLTADGRGFLKPSKAWYFKYRDAAGTVRRVKGFSDLKATEQLAAETERKASRVKAGLIDPAEEHARRPLVDHLADYAGVLESKGDTAEHVGKTAGRVKAMFAGCKFVFAGDIDAGRVAEWLNAHRRDAAPVPIPPGDSFTPAAVAKILGVRGSTVAVAVRRLNLTGTGYGKARTYSRAVVEALVLNRGKGCGPATINHHIRAVKAFCRWMTRSKRFGSNPLETLTLVNESADVRHARRELTAAELGKLFEITRVSTRTFRGLTGVDRYTLYLTAAGTGFRARSLANLTPADFDTQAGTVTLPARFNKSRKVKVQPLPVDVAAVLRDYLTDKPVNAPVWSGEWVKRSAGMLRVDLKAAGIAYCTDGPDGPEYADFHALRHSFLTMLGRNGVDLRTAQELAGHSTPILTARYSHVRLHDLAGAVGKLPALVPTVRTANEVEIPLRMTGTDAVAGVPRGVPGVPPGVPTGYAGRHSPAPSGTLRIVGGGEDDAPERLENQGHGTDSHRSAPLGNDRRGGTRTRMTREGRGILSPLCLPFHHSPR